MKNLSIRTQVLLVALLPLLVIALLLTGHFTTHRVRELDRAAPAFRAKGHMTSRPADQPREGRSHVPPRVLFVCFLLSGFAGLLYQTVWTRLALARFGVNAPVIAAVLTAFMLGLAVGNALGGRWAERIEARLGFGRLQLYAITELVIGAGGVVVPAILDLGRRVLLGLRTTDSAGYTAASAIAVGVALVPFCAAMGPTFPAVLAYAKRRSGDDRAPAFSALYLANVW